MQQRFQLVKDIYQSNVSSHFDTLIHRSSFLWITVVVTEGKLGFHYPRRNTLQGRDNDSLLTVVTLTAKKNTFSMLPKTKHLDTVMTTTYRGSDASVCFSELLSYPLCQSSHSIFSGTEEVLISTWHHSVSTHTITGRGDRPACWSSC